MTAPPGRFCPACGHRAGETEPVCYRCKTPLPAFLRPSTEPSRDVGSVLGWLVLAFAAFVIFAIANPKTPMAPESVRADPPMPIERQLAVIDGATGFEETPDERRFRYLIEEFRARWGADPTHVADIFVGTRQEMRKAGVDDKLLPMMEGVHLYAPPGGPHELEKALAAYAALRIKGVDHEGALRGIRPLMEYRR